MKLLLKIAAGIIALVVLVLVGVNLLISADAVRDRVAARVKEQTGRELRVNGSTSLLLLPNPNIVITDVSITDPSDRANAADLSVARLELDLSFAEMLSRRVDAEHVVLVQPVLTVRLNGAAPGDPQTPETHGSLESKQPIHASLQSLSLVTPAAAAETDPPQRDIQLRDVRIEDGTVRIVYDDQGTERRLERIDANLSLPHVTDPLTAKGRFDWKGSPLDFDLTLTSPSELRNERQAKLELSLSNEAIVTQFDGTVATRPSFALEGDLGAKSHSLPSLLAWMREKPDSIAAIGDGELASHVVWKPGEITFSNARFALAQGSGKGQAVVTLQSPRPYVRAALAVDKLDLDAYLPNGAHQQPAAAPPQAAAEPEPAPPPAEEKPQESGGGTWFAKPDSERSAGPAGPKIHPQAPAQPAGANPGTPAAQQSSGMAMAPAAFDADVNLVVTNTKVSGLTIGTSSIGLGLKEGILTATLGSMQLYDGQGQGKLVIDASKPVPAFSGELNLDGVSAGPLLTDAAKFQMLSGRAKLDLQVKGGGATMQEIKSSLTGRGSLALNDGAIQGIDLTAMIKSIGAGEMPELKQSQDSKTDFSTLGGSFALASGVASSTDLQMTSPLLEVSARGTVDMVLGSLDILAKPQIIAGPQGKGGANDLAGLEIPVRIEGPFAHPSIKPEIKGLFANPEQASRTVKQLGDVLQKKFKGKPVGEAIGKILGGIQIRGKQAQSGDADQAEDETAAPQSRKKGQTAAPSAGAAPEADPDEEGAEPEKQEEEKDPDLRNILR